jgi:hypothetical protein
VDHSCADHERPHHAVHVVHDRPRPLSRAHPCRISSE